MSELTARMGSNGETNEAHSMSENVRECPNGADGRFGHAAQVPAGLSDAQRRAIELLMSGTSQAKTAKAVGVDPRTVYRWRHEHAPFRAELDHARRAMWATTLDRMRGMIERSLAVLSVELDDEYDRSRVRAASIVLHHSGLRKLMEAEVKDAEG